MSALLGVQRTASERPTEPAELTRDLYERYGQRVFTFCYSRLRDREAAQDAAQTTFIYVLRSLQRGVVPEFELAWLLKIAFNVCRGVRRSAGRETAVTQDVEDIDGLAAPADAGPEATERLDALRDGLAALPDSQRRGILLREWQGLSYAEIADELGVTVGAVETLLFRARRNLASRLQHVRSGVGALDVASLATLFRSAFRGGLLKLGLLGAGASIALVPVIAAEVSPALAERRADVAMPSLPKLPAARTAADGTSRGQRLVAAVRPTGSDRVAAPPVANARPPRFPQKPLADAAMSEGGAPVPAERTTSPAAVAPPAVAALSPPPPTPTPTTPPALPPTELTRPAPQLPAPTLPPLELDPVGTVVKTVNAVGAALPW